MPRPPFTARTFACFIAAALTAFTESACAQRVAARAATGRVELPVAQQDRTRASSGRIAAQVVVGAIAAASVGFAAWALVDNPEGADRRVKGDAGYTPNANTAFALGSFLAGTLATFAMGQIDGSRGSVAATALGTAIATIPIALGRHEPYLPILGIVLGAPLQAIGGTIGYQVTRRER